MILITRYHKKCKVAYLKVIVLALSIYALFLPVLKPVKSVGNNIFTLYLNGKEMGTVDDEQTADRILSDARREVVGSETGVVFVDAEYSLTGDEIMIGLTDDPEVVYDNVKAELTRSVVGSLQLSYTVKIDEFMVNLSSIENVKKLLNAAIHRYDTDGKFNVELVTDSTRELPVLVPKIELLNPEEEESSVNDASLYLTDEGVIGAITDALDNIELEDLRDFTDYDYGITDISFDDRVEVVETYLPRKYISNLNDAIESVVKDKEQKTVYEVVAGDTLSGISNKTGISMDELIDLNESLTSVNSIIRIGEELTITVPQPELSVNREELEYYEGTYEADIIYKYNDNWYTTEEVTLQEPSSGYHKAVERVVYRNNEALSREVIKEEVIAEAVPKIVEKGTRIPPTYIKPISSNYITSGYGYRTSTMRGMTSNHKAVDWAAKTGTSVFASCGGTVDYAAWMDSYGYVVFINHPDGRQTRYAHLSKILVSKGQYVSQGEKIALSGMTGVATGPHLHFEMRINGKPVNPLNYISY